MKTIIAACSQNLSGKEYPNVRMVPNAPAPLRARAISVCCHYCLFALRLLRGKGGVGSDLGLAAPEENIKLLNRNGIS